MREGKIPLPIEHCRSWFKFLCPKTWSQLERTTQLDVRYCSTCRQNVFYCDSLEAVEEHRRAGHCICIEAGTTDQEDTMCLGEPWNEE
jgi:hypothetical protein